MCQAFKGRVEWTVTSLDERSVNKTRLARPFKASLHVPSFDSHSTIPSKSIASQRRSTRTHELHSTNGRFLRPSSFWTFASQAAPKEHDHMSAGLPPAMPTLAPMLMWPKSQLQADAVRVPLKRQGLRGWNLC